MVQGLLQDSSSGSSAKLLSGYSVPLPWCTKVVYRLGMRKRTCHQLRTHQRTQTYAAVRFVLNQRQIIKNFIQGQSILWSLGLKARNRRGHEVTLGLVYNLILLTNLVAVPRCTRAQKPVSRGKLATHKMWCSQEDERREVEIPTYIFQLKQVRFAGWRPSAPPSITW